MSLRGGLLLVASLVLGATAPLRFENVAAVWGLVHSTPNGGDSTKTHIVETTGSGLALFDFDNDGHLDLFLPSGPGAPSRLYRNTGRRRFVEQDGGVPQPLALATGAWLQGVCAGDFDNDGYTDLFLTAWGDNRLLRNERGSRLLDVTESAKLVQSRIRYNTGCAFLDYDRDGDLDLFVANYLKFDFTTTPKPGSNPYCFYRSLPVACGPRGLPFDRNLLYRNEGDGTFTDMSTLSGVATPSQNYCLGVSVSDVDDDGWPDVFVACDQTPSLLYMNQRDGTFSEEALLRGVALDENGKALSGMGAFAADYDGDGKTDLFRTNFSDERETLYRNRGDGTFDETTVAAGLAHNTRFVGWGCALFDADHDGWRDLLLVNGHVFPEVERLRANVRYRDRAIFYRNRAKGGFADHSEAAGPGLLERHSARGLAVGDLDNDGTVEVVVSNQNEPPTLLRQAAAPVGSWVLFKLEGVQSNRSGIGARIRITSGGGTQTAEVQSGGSYLSQGDLRVHFGLGSATVIDRVEIRWPLGTQQVLEKLPVNRQHTIRER